MPCDADICYSEPRDADPCRDRRHVDRSAGALQRRCSLRRPEREDDSLTSALRQDFLYHECLPRDETENRAFRTTASLIFLTWRFKVLGRTVRAYEQRKRPFIPRDTVLSNATKWRQGIPKCQVRANLRKIRTVTGYESGKLGQLHPERRANLSFGLHSMDQHVRRSRFGKPSCNCEKGPNPILN